MLYIVKGFPPRDMVRKVSEIRSSQEWKRIKDGDTKAVRAEFDKLPKEIIRQTLLEDQRYLCAYCMRKIKNDGLKTAIEHWYPLSRDKEQALDYGNMLAVCDGGKSWRGREKRILCCDAYKADEIALKISPLNKQQMEKIVYHKDGFIKTYPKDEKLDEDINEKLRLNGIWKKGEFIADTSTGLVKGRKDAYLRYKRFIKKLSDRGECTSGRIKKKMIELEKAEQGQEYMGVLLYYLNRKYNVLLKRGQ